MQRQVLGKYRIDRVIGKGAMGVIYEAYDDALQRKVAIKTMTSEVMNDPQLRKRFYTEARAAGNMRHPNIITIFDMGEDGQVPYIVMELLQGTDLKSMMQSETTWSFAKILNVMIQAAKGLHFAHQKGIVHRDIKPANIFICQDGIVKILDFGVAHVLSSTMTQAGMLLGSLGYMAPEQIIGEKVDGRADQYSIGVILYELLTGVKPFLEKDITATIQSILKKPPVPLRQVRADCPEHLEQIVLKSLQKERDQRYPHLDEMARDLTVIYGAMTTADGTARALILSNPDTGTLASTTPPKPREQADTRAWRSMGEVLSQSRALHQSGSLGEAFNLMKEHYKLYQKDPEFQTYFRNLRQEKESLDKRALFQKHYQDALRLLKEDNFQLARLEMETLLKIDASSPLISQLEQQISRAELLGQIQEWSEEGDKIILAKDHAMMVRHLEEGDERFGTIKDFTARKDLLLTKWEKVEIEAVLLQIQPLETADRWEEAVDLIRPFLRRYSRNRELVEKYNHLMSMKLEHDRQLSMQQFSQDQLKIVDLLLKSQQYGQAKNYLLVLLEKFPGTAEFEEKMIEVENRLDFEKSIEEIRGCIDEEDLPRAEELFEILREAYPGEVQIEILQHELDHLRLSRTNADALESAQSRLANAVNLAGKGAYDKALDIIRDLMSANPEHTFLYTNYLKIKAEKETREKEELIRGLQSLDELDKRGELAMAMEKARQLSEHFPAEETLPTLYGAIRKRFVLQLEGQVRKAVAAGQLQQASALLESHIKLVPDEKQLLELQDSLDMEKQKNEHIRQEMLRARQAVKENRIDDALETVNSLIPLSPNNQELKEFLKDVIYRKTRSL